MEPFFLGKSILKGRRGQGGQYFIMVVGSITNRGIKLFSFQIQIKTDKDFLALLIRLLALSSATQHAISRKIRRKVGNIMS